MLILDSGGLYAVLDRDEEAGLLRLAAGRALPEIAGDLGVSISTVRRPTGGRGRVEAVRRIVVQTP